MERQHEVSENEKIVMQVSVRSMLVNLILSAGKGIAGVIGHSSAMVSDAIHSASDVFSTIIVMVGYKMSERDSDKNHPYGHERMECVAAILLAVVLCITGVAIGITGIRTMFGIGETSLEVPGMLPLVAAILSILVKEGMYHYTKRAAKKVNSGALMADAWHHRSDSLSSIGSLIGIAGARMGYPICDPIASVIISIFIVKAAFDIFKDAIDKMMDTACDEETIEQIREVISKQNGVLHIDSLQSRQFGARAYVDVEIAADGSLTLTEAHAIAERVHEQIEISFPEVKHCMVHVNPAKKYPEN